MSINRVTITGNLTRDPELRQSTGGTAILRMGVAVNDRRYNQQTQQWEDQPNYIDCVVFGKRAESLSRFLQKGSKVAIEGKLRWSSWQAKDGSNRSKVEVVVDDLEFFSSRQQGAAPAQAAAPQMSQGNGYPAQQQQMGQAPQMGQGNGYAQQQAPQMQQAPQQVPAQFAAQQETAPYQAPMPNNAPVQRTEAVPPSGDVYNDDIPF